MKYKFVLKSQPYLLKNSIQHYEWGTKGKRAFIPKLLNTKSKNDKSYAELWMGAHPKSPSRILVDGSEFNLDEVIRQYPQEMLGSKTAKKFSNSLPFLFKVLSANETLSIQAHPNKRQAIALHKKDPVNYPDDNHKIEIAIALDSLSALVGFKPFDQIINILKEYPEIGAFIDERYFTKLRVHNILSNDGKKASVKKIFTQLIKKSVSDEKALASANQALFSRLTKKKNPTEIEELFIELVGKYKNDIGLLIIFFLNLVYLKRGEAIFTKPGIPHAYLKGNILECMSSSDNVIRAGLTPKYKDLSALLDILTFESGSPKILEGKRLKTNVVYETGAKEFAIKIFHAGKKNINFKDQSGPRILLVLEGGSNFLVEDDGKIKQYKFSKGDVIFLPSILKQFKIASAKTSKFVQVSVPA